MFFCFVHSLFVRKYGNMLVLIRSLQVLFWCAVVALFLFFPSRLFSPGEKKSITICAWSDQFDEATIVKFEEETGITVNMSYFETNEELFLKMSSNVYDLILPGDYAVDILREKGALKKLDKTKLDFYQHLNPLLMGLYFDKHNEYSLPYEWSVFGIGVNKKCFEGPIDDSWALIFDEQWGAQYPVVMTNDPLVAMPLASYYLFGTGHFVREHLSPIKALLKRQRQWVEAYTDFRAHQYLASGDVCVVFGASSYILMTMREYPYIDFIIPREGTLVAVESFAVPYKSTNEEGAYTFMNFVMRPENVVERYKILSFLPTTLNVLDLIEVHPLIKNIFMMEKEEFFNKFHLLDYKSLRSMLSDQALQDLWVQVKG